MLEQYIAEKAILPNHHPAYTRIVHISNRIIKSNQDIEQLRGKQWTVTVVEDGQKNAFVLPVSKDS